VISPPASAPRHDAEPGREMRGALGATPLASPSVSTSESTDVLVCDRCGRPCTEVEDGRNWLHLEITREQSIDSCHWWEVDYCSQAHAAEWLSGPLPEPVRDTGTPSPTRWDDVVAFAVVLVILGLFGLGSGRPSDCWSASSERCKGR
jgi:hypothetical protein